ncbi:MAG: serine/threonine protein kinase [Planctomycetes bacterium]|nr:serine/threonine protein kinase [Planctomycetota bacterium]
MVEDPLEQLAGRLADREPLRIDELLGDPRLEPGQRRALGLLARMSAALQASDPPLSPGLAPLEPEAGDTANGAANGAASGAATETAAGYELLEELGRGSFGVVWRARERLLQREVALKVIRRDESDPASAAEQAEARARFVREARILASLDHPNIVRIWAVEQVGEELHLALELLHGMTLHDLAKERGPLSADEAASIGLHLCRALAAVHGKGLVHRDVKPANVMRVEGGRIVLLDFGVTEAPRPAEPQRALGGTPLYMPPEVALDGVEPTPPCDLYALGVTLYWLVSRRHPYEASEREGLWERMDAAPTPLRTHRPDLPASYVAVVERAIARDPTRRFQSAGELELALLACEAEGARQLAAVRELGVTRRRALQLLVAASVVIAATWFLADALVPPAPPPAAPPLVAECAFVLRGRDGKERRVERSAAIDEQDQLFVELHADRPNHVYVFEEDLTGAVWKLQPAWREPTPNGPTSERAAGAARLLLAGHENPIPACPMGEPFTFPTPGERGYAFTCVEGGADALLVIQSSRAIAAAEALLERAPPVDGLDPAAPERPGRRAPTRSAKRAAHAAPTVAAPSLASFPTLHGLVRAIEAELAAQREAPAASNGPPPLEAKVSVVVLSHRTGTTTGE